MGFSSDGGTACISLIPKFNVHYMTDGTGADALRTGVRSCSLQSAGPGNDVIGTKFVIVPREPSAAPCALIAIDGVR